MATIDMNMGGRNPLVTVRKARKFYLKFTIVI